MLVVTIRSFSEKFLDFSLDQIKKSSSEEGLDRFV